MATDLEDSWNNGSKADSSLSLMVSVSDALKADQKML